MNLVVRQISNYFFTGSVLYKVVKWGFASTMLCLLGKYILYRSSQAENRVLHNIDEGHIDEAFKQIKLLKRTCRFQLYYTIFTKYVVKPKWNLVDRAFSQCQLVENRSSLLSEQYYNMAKAYHKEGVDEQTKVALTRALVHIKRINCSIKKNRICFDIIEMYMGLEMSSAALAVVKHMTDKRQQFLRCCRIFEKSYHINNLSQCKAALHHSLLFAESLCIEERVKIYQDGFCLARGSDRHIAEWIAVLNPIDAICVGCHIICERTSLATMLKSIEASMKQIVLSEDKALAYCKLAKAYIVIQKQDLARGAMEQAEQLIPDVSTKQKFSTYCDLVSLYFAIGSKGTASDWMNEASELENLIKDNLLLRKYTSVRKELRSARINK